MRTENFDGGDAGSRSHAEAIKVTGLEEGGFASDGSRVYFSFRGPDGRPISFVATSDAAEGIGADLQRLVDAARSTSSEDGSERERRGSIIRTRVREVDEALVDVAVDGQWIALSLKSGAIWSRFAMVPHGCARLAEALAQNYREWRSRHARH